MAEQRTHRQRKGYSQATQQRKRAEQRRQQQRRQKAKQQDIVE